MLGELGLVCLLVGGRIVGGGERLVMLNVNRAWWERGGMTRVRWTGDVGSSHRIQNLGFAGRLIASRSGLISGSRDSFRFSLVEKSSVHPSFCPTSRKCSLVFCNFYHSPCGCGIQVNEMNVYQRNMDMSLMFRRRSTAVLSSR